MNTLAQWLWNPVFCLMYLILGVVFLWLTRLVAWRKSFLALKIVLKDDITDYDKRLVSHRKGFFSSVAATVGIGNLAGVGTAIHLGGPGALFWMCVSALLGMSFRMIATYLSIKYRPADTNSNLFATPMVYLEKHIKPGSWRWLIPTVAGLILANGVILGNVIQSNSVSHALNNRFDIPDIITALVITAVVAAVILGGLKRIVEFSSAIAPWMILLYVGAALLILLFNPLKAIESLGMVIYYAFTPYAAVGGVVGYSVFQAMQFGLSRGIFSHNSGTGISPFLQGSNEDHPANGAIMSTITPVVDTVIVCTLTGLVILSLSPWQQNTGAYLTAQAFENGLGILGQVIYTASLIVFAFTTIVTYSYYTERCFLYLGGENPRSFRLFLLVMTFMGPLVPVAAIWSFCDILVGLLLTFHLFPLLYIFLMKSKIILTDLENSDTKITKKETQINEYI